MSIDLSVYNLLVQTQTPTAMKYICLFLIFTVTIALDTTDYESKLHDDIIAKLPKDIHSRPVHTTTNVTNLYLYVAVGHIIGLDAKTDTFSISGYLIHNWEDERVRWDRANYGGLRVTVIPENVLWKPVLYPYNNARFSSLNDLYAPNIVIAHYDGYLIWAPSITSNTTCPMDLRWFPYDEHDCIIELGAWWYSGLEINITVEDHQMTETELMWYGDVNNEWELVKFYRERKVPYPENPNNWHTAKINFHVRRRAPYYQLLLVLPIVLGIFLCLIVFWIPESIKRTVISFNLLFLSLFVSHIFWVVPRSGSSAPAILILASNTLALTGVSLLFTTITEYINKRSDESFPGFLQTLLSGWLGKILCLQQTPPAVEARLNDTDGTQMEVASPSEKVKETLWMMLATAFDRLLFIIYLIAFFIIVLVAFT